MISTNALPVIGVLIFLVPTLAGADAPAEDAGIVEARRLRDEVMPRLWMTPSGATAADQLASTIGAYVPDEQRLSGPHSPFPGAVDRDDPAANQTLDTTTGTTALTMEACIETAVEHNLGIQIAQFSRKAAEADVSQAKAKFHPVLGGSWTHAEDEAAGTTTQASTAFLTEELPTGGSLSVSGDLTREETSAETVVPAVGGSVVAHDATMTVSIVQPLLRGGRIYVARQAVRDAQYDRDVAEAQLRAEVLRVIAEAKSAYYNTILAEKIIDVTMEAVERDEALIEASEALFEAGLVTKRDVFSAEILLATDKAKLAEAEADLELSRNNLLDTLGLPITMALELVDKDVSFDPIVLSADRWVETAVSNRPEVLAVESRMEKSRLNIGVTRNSRYPNLDVVASYGLSNSDPRRDIALRLPHYDWSAGVVVSMPIGAAAERASTRRAEFEHEQLERELLQQTKRQIELEVRAGAIKLRTSLQKMNALAIGVEQAQGKLEFAKERFALGLATNLDITDAQEDLLAAETDLLTAIVDYNVGLAELEASVAGPLS